MTHKRKNPYKMKSTFGKWYLRWEGSLEGGIEEQTVENPSMAPADHKDFFLGQQIFDAPAAAVLT